MGQSASLLCVQMFFGLVMHSSPMNVREDCMTSVKSICTCTCRRVVQFWIEDVSESPEPSAFIRHSKASDSLTRHVLVSRSNHFYCGSL